MFCPNCGTNLPDGTPVCTTCGRQLNAPQQPAPQPVYQQPVYQQPVYQAPPRPMPITKKEYLKTKAPEGVKKTAAIVNITLILTLILVIVSAILPLTVSIFDIPVVDTVFDLIDDEEADPDKLLDEIEDAYKDAKLEFKYEKDYMTKSERNDAEKALDATEKLVDSFSVLNLKAFVDMAAEVADDYDLGVTQSEAEEISAAMVAVIVAMLGGFLLPLVLTLIAGLTKSTGVTVAALIFTVLSQLSLCGFVWVVLSLVLFIAQAVICSKVNKAYQDYRMGRTAA